MTPPARPDPVGALSALVLEMSKGWLPGSTDAEKAGIQYTALWMAKEYVKQGYVLVSADSLAHAMEEDGWEFNGDPVFGAQSILEKVR